MGSLIEALGWMGTVLFISSYFMVATDRLRPTGRVYLTMNLIGALGLCLSVLQTESWPALAGNLAWATIAAWALAGTFPKLRPKKPRGGANRKKGR